MAGIRAWALGKLKMDVDRRLIDEEGDFWEMRLLMLCGCEAMYGFINKEKNFGLDPLENR